MSNSDEMGLTPEAALGYEQFFVPAIFNQWPARITASAEISNGDHVLDVGCGTGVLTREVARIVAGVGQATGFDLSDSMLNVARKMCPDAVFQQGNVCHMPFEDDSFDAVVSAFMLMFVPDPVKALGEIRRVLKPGGRVAVAVWQGLDSNPVYDALVQSTRDVTGDENADSMAWPFAMGNAGRLRDLMTQAGFEDVLVAAHDGNGKFPSVEDLVKTEIQAWLLADSVDEDQILQITTSLRSKYTDFSNQNGPIEFPLNALIAKGFSN